MLAISSRFATAHSRGLRRKCLEIEKDYDALPQRIRAGCDAISAPVVTMLWPLPQRIRAGCDSHRERYRVPVAAFATAHSRGLRPPPANRKNRIIHFATAHSCGLRRNKLINACNFVTLCHSAFARVATTFDFKLKSNRKLCHSAFARVATELPLRLTQTMVFATAHSCGLRLRKSNAAHCEFAARR